MGFQHYFILLLVTALLALILRVVQVRSFTRIEIYIFVFGPLLAMSVIMLFFALVDLNRDVFFPVGQVMAIYSAIGLGAGYIFSTLVDRF
ncbi:hypothetical protein J2R98_002054 [Alkalibacillus filiformis]|uniref:YesK-like protein n=1 Tax=Alkalibacillus filiformis TaxID=200990 RepID=A0ABU0DV29_9BACI|nr:hypothetical protein [Alkalibacillus filiformis]MDQ0352220.1 hypothetical protein [Alkalibacillus filiformis]